MDHNQKVDMELSRLLADHPREICKLAIDLRRHIVDLAARMF